MKAFYLDGCLGLDVRLDGPALRVRRPGRADGQYPLPRVSRIIVVGRVRWQPEALAACLTGRKPIAVLDRQGRLVRILFRPPGSPYGLARNMGELLEVPRFRDRYEQWFGETERTEIRSTLDELGIRRQELEPDHTWQAICSEQHRRWGLRVGGCYRYMLGLTAAQIGASYLRIGLRRNAQHWDRQEYQLFCDTVRIERWRQAVLLEKMLSRHTGRPERRELTVAFESVSDERERCTNLWRGMGRS